jgi:hypothetical protein
VNAPAPVVPVTELDVSHPTLVIRDYWLAALKYFALGRTANDLRDEAADPEWVRGMALEGGITEEQERAQLLAVADRIADLKAEGLTPVKCWYLSGLDQFLGPFPGTGTLKSEPLPDANGSPS